MASDIMYKITLQLVTVKMRIIYKMKNSYVAWKPTEFAF